MKKRGEIKEEIERKEENTINLLKSLFKNKKSPWGILSEENLKRFKKLFNELNKIWKTNTPFVFIDDIKWYKLTGGGCYLIEGSFRKEKQHLERLKKFRTRRRKTC